MAAFRETGREEEKAARDNRDAGTYKVNTSPGKELIF